MSAKVIDFTRHPKTIARCAAPAPSFCELVLQRARQLQAQSKGEVAVVVLVLQPERP